MKIRDFFTLLLKVIKNRFLRPTTPQKPFIYVALGDSTTEGIGASDPSNSFPSLIYLALKKELPFVQYHNFGKKYSRIKNVVENQLPKAVELTPDLVTISVGANDIFLRLGTKKFQSYFQFLLETLKKQTSAIIVVNNVPDFTLVTRGPKLFKTVANFKARNINKILEEETKKSGGIFVDINAHSKLLKNYSDLISDDGIHPSDLGHAIWGGAIISAVKPVILEKHKKQDIGV